MVLIGQYFFIHACQPFPLRPALPCFVLPAYVLFYFFFTCSGDSPCIISCWVWFKMYWKYSYVGRGGGTCCTLWTWHPLQLGTPEETSDRSIDRSIERRAAAKAPRVFVSPHWRGSFLSCVAHLHLWWLLFLKWKNWAMYTLMSWEKGKSVEPMRSCECVWAPNVTDYQ